MVALLAMLNLTKDRRILQQRLPPYGNGIPSRSDIARSAT